MIIVIYYIIIVIYYIIYIIEIYKFKASNKNVKFPSQFCLGSIPNKFDYIDSEEVSLKGNVYDFQADYNALHKSSILNIYIYLIGKNSIK